MPELKPLVLGNGTRVPPTKAKSVLKQLKAARELISDRAHWTRGNYAVNKAHYPVNSRSTNAEQFCAIGALHHVTTGNSGHAFSLLYNSITELYPKTDLSITQINDKTGRNRGHKAVLRLYDHAIAKLEKYLDPSRDSAAG